jgi:hypothetical protein
MIRWISFLRRKARQKGRMLRHRLVTLLDHVVWFGLPVGQWACGSQAGPLGATGRTLKTGVRTSKPMGDIATGV